MFLDPSPIQRLVGGCLSTALYHALTKTLMMCVSTQDECEYVSKPFMYRKGCVPYFRLDLESDSITISIPA